MKFEVTIYDYTEGCPMTFQHIEAENREAALRRVQAKFRQTLPQDTVARSCECKLCLRDRDEQFEKEINERMHRR